MILRRRLEASRSPGSRAYGKVLARRFTIACLACVMVVCRSAGAAAPSARSETPSFLAPAPEPVSIRREDLLDRIARQARRVRGSDACGSRAHQDAFLEAFLYRASCESGECDASRAASAMDHLRRARAFQICRGPGGVDAACHARCAEQEDGVRFHWLEQPSAAWEWISQAPSVEISEMSEMKACLRLANR